MDLHVVFILAALGIVHGKLIQSCNITRGFVDGHNMFRKQLARGQVPGQPAASNMTYVIWDDELARIASNWASKNQFQHSPGRSNVASGRFDFVGENLYIYRTTVKEHNFDLQTALQAWWEEHYDYKFGKITRKVNFNNSKQVGHYTQMAWADSVRVGCAISQYYDGKWNSFLVVCNYGPGGNIINQPPYKTGKGVSNSLQCGVRGSECSKMYGNKC